MGSLPAKSPPRQWPGSDPQRQTRKDECRDCGGAAAAAYASTHFRRGKYGQCNGVGNADCDVIDTRNTGKFGLGDASGSGGVTARVLILLKQDSDHIAIGG